MDKETLSNYGWVVICVLVLAVMMALATPFGSYVANGVKSTAEGLFGANRNALNAGLASVGVQIEDQQFENVPTVNGNVRGEATPDTNTPELDMSKVDSILANNDWATIQAVVKANKVTEAGWGVGDLSPTFNINGKSNMQARIVDIEGSKVTFMLTSSIGEHHINSSSASYPYGDNIGGYPDSEMNTWLEGTVYSGLDDNLKSVIASSSIVCANDYKNPNGTKAISCHLFLPSIKEMGLSEDLSSWYPYMSAIEAEGNTFDWFANRQHIINDTLWLRTVFSPDETEFHIYVQGYNQATSTYFAHSVYPAFVIG